MRQKRSRSASLIHDNGSGIPQPVRESLFQPFVSHGKENGIGLGLAVVQKIIQDHGGQVNVQRTGPEGTVFRVILPLTMKAAPDECVERRPDTYGEH